MKTVYILFCTDVIHEGHRNIIRRAQEYGRVIAGVLCDAAMIRFNRFPTISFQERKRLLEAIEEISEVVVQEDLFYDKILETIKPDFIFHGDNWITRPEKIIRERLLEWIGSGKTNCQLIEVPYTRNETVRKIDIMMTDRLSMPEYRRKRLRRILEISSFAKVLEVHNGLTGLIAEKTIVENGGELSQFDAMWISSLCDSTAKGRPDIELVDMSSRLNTINEVMEVTTKPIIFDGDTGGLLEHFVYNVRTLERIGVSAVIIEDKKGLKRNSLLGTEVEQQQEDIDVFCDKISAGKRAKITDDFMIIARIESLILEAGMEDALDRARAYAGAGADGIMIHSCRTEADEVFEFCERFRREFPEIPLVAVPTAYAYVTEEELKAHGVNIVIYANQLTRSSFPAMRNVARKILMDHSSRNVEPDLMPISEIVNLIDVM